MKAANLEQGFVIRYDDKPWRVTERAISTARGNGCVVEAWLHDRSWEGFINCPTELVFDSFEEDVWVYHFGGSDDPTDWAYPAEVA